MHVMLSLPALPPSVGQNVDYETFKNMVAVAHLRPLHAANMANNGMPVCSFL